MQTQFTNHDSLDAPSILSHSVSGYPQADYSLPEDLSRTVNEPTQFHSEFIGRMDMYAPASAVAKYLDVHQDWFCRCAHPMKVRALADNGYALTVGRFGSFGYEIEPKIGLHLLPQDEGVYRIETIPVPDYVPTGYDVDFKAALKLVEALVDSSEAEEEAKPMGLPTEYTRVEWNLALTVTIQFPRFIQSLPKSLIQKTGDHLLYQIVRQVSRRLTFKVQEDFHKSQGIVIPKHSRKHFFWQGSAHPDEENS